MFEAAVATGNGRQTAPNLTVLRPQRPNLSSDDETNVGTEMSGWSSDYGLPFRERSLRDAPVRL